MAKWLNYVVAVAVSSTMVTGAHAQDKKNSKSAQPETAAQPSSDKLDLNQLENKYWAAKDSDFGVVQNRTYAKEKRMFASLGYGSLLNDSYSLGRMLNFSGGYYFNERWGVELAYEKGSLTDNGSTSALSQYNGLKPNFNKFVDYTSVNVMWVPLYAKMSFVDKAIWYFDLQIGGGLGMMNYQAQIDPTEASNINKSAIGFNFDTAAQIFFSSHWAVRMDVKNKWTTQDLTRFRLSGSGASNRSMGTQNQQDTSLLIGVTYFH